MKKLFNTKNLIHLQKKTNVSNVLWAWGNGMALNDYYTKEVFLGHKLGNTVWVCKGDDISVATDQTTNINRLNKAMKVELAHNPNHARKIRNIFEIKIKITKKLICALEKNNLSQKSNKQLLNLYNKIAASYIDVYPYGEPISLASQDFAKWLQSKFGGSEEEFGVLINPVEKSFLQREQQELLKIAISVKNSKANKDSLIKKHTKKYTWIPYDYGANFYSEKYFLTELDELLKKDVKDLMSEYNNYKNYSSRLLKNQNVLFKKYKITGKEKEYYKILQIEYFLLDYKKEIFTRLHWSTRRLFDEIGKRLNLNSKQIKYILPNEMNDFLTGKNIPEKSFLDNRNKGFVLIIKSGRKIDTIEGVEAQEIVKKYYQKKENNNLEIRGSTAQRGVVKAKARLITDSKKCGKLKKGEILVTTMTSPDFMVAVKKASAIVTDEGGIICHAAIVARELGIPCVVGTKIASEAIKTGDKLEVNANHGVVKILKSLAL
jgi:phosphohistidine swiveling domain-containing protein